MEVAEAAKDWLTHRSRFCAETTAVATTLGGILQSPFEDRDDQQVERCMARLARLRRDLDALAKDRAAILGADGYRKLRLSDRRDIEDDTPFGADPRRLLQGWNRILGAARTAADSAPAPLFPDALPPGGSEAQRWDAADNLLHLLHEFINPRETQIESFAEDGYYTDIPLLLSKFLNLCMVARRVCLAQGRRAPMKFLDVGCGGGIKVLQASQFFADCHGLEVDPGFFDVADRLLTQVGGGRCRVMQGDALEFAGYRHYDVIYFFTPIKDRDKMAMLERKIVADAMAGTVLIAPYPYFEELAPDLGCAQLGPYVWLTDTAQAEADALAERAAGMACALTPVALTPIDQAAGLLSPLASALDAMGFELTI